MKKRIVILLVSILPTTSFAQNAKEFLEKVMESYGPWQDLQTIRYKSVGKNYNKWQNYSFHNPKPTKDEAFREFDFKSRTYYMETVSRYGGGYEFRFANIGKDTTRFQYDMLQSRNGKVLSTGGKRAYDAGWLLLNETFPFYTLKTVLASGDSLIMSDNTIVRRFFKDGSYEEYYFSGNDLQKFSKTTNGVVNEKVFARYRQQNHLRYPVSVTNYTNKELVRVDEVKELSINQPFNQSLLTIPADYKSVTIAPVAMKVSEISSGVFLIEGVTGGRNVLFVEMSDGILVTEAPLSTEVAQSIINLVKKTVPGKPIKYVHISHFHNDHTSGIRAFVAEGATVLATPATIAAVKTLIEEKKGKNDPLSKGEVKPVYLPFNKEHILKDAKAQLRFYEIYNTHAEGMSFLYLPVQKIIYQGDLYSLPDDGTITPAIEITRGFKRFIDQRKLSVERIVGHHGSSNITMEILNKAVQMKKK